MARDTQRQRVYNWEHACLRAQVPPDEFNITLHQCQEVVNRIARFYGYRPGLEPEVWDGRGCRKALSEGGSIALPRWARVGYIICHEMAHEVVRRFKPWALQWASHGPEFVRVYIEILTRFDGWSRGDLLTSARNAGVKIASRTQCDLIPFRRVPQPKLRVSEATIKSVLARKPRQYPTGIRIPKTINVGGVPCALVKTDMIEVQAPDGYRFDEDDLHTLICSDMNDVRHRIAGLSVIHCQPGDDCACCDE